LPDRAPLLGEFTDFLLHFVPAGRHVVALAEWVALGAFSADVIPGVGHGFGPLDAKIDSLTALKNWGEKGQVPMGLTTTDGNLHSS
jgi:hypothetical protein